MIDGVKTVVSMSEDSTAFSACALARKKRDCECSDAPIAEKKMKRLTPARSAARTMRRVPSPFTSSIVAFDRTFAQAAGINLWAFDQLFLILLSLAIVTPLMVIDLAFLRDEVLGLEKRGIDTANLRISDRAHVLMPWHVALDRLEIDDHVLELREILRVVDQLQTLLQRFHAEVICGEVQAERLDDALPLIVGDGALRQVR